MTGEGPVETIFFIINVYFVALLGLVGYFMFKGRGGLLAFLASAPLLIYIVAFGFPAPYPTLYAVVSCMLLSLYIKLVRGEIGASLLYWGFSLLEGVIGVVMTASRAYQEETYPFLVLSLTSGLLVLSASHSMMSRRGRVTTLAVRASLSLAALLWTMESYTLIISKGASWENILGRIHILTLAFSALTVAYGVESRSPNLRVISCFIGLLSGVFVISMIQGGVLARDLYVGRLEAIGSIYYLLPVFYAFTRAIEGARNIIVLPVVERSTYALWGGLTFFTIFSFVGMMFEGMGMAGPAQHLEAISTVFPYFTVASIVGVGLLRGLGWRSILAAAFAVLISISICYVVNVDFRLGWAVGYLVTLSLLMAARGGDPLRALPATLCLIIIVILAVSYIQFSGAEYSFKAYIFEGQTVRPLPDLELKLRSFSVDFLNFDLNSIHGTILLEVSYKGRDYSLAIPYTYAYTGFLGWRFKSVPTAAILEPDYVMWMKLLPSLEILGSLRAAYLQAVTTGAYPAKISGLITVEGQIYPHMMLYIVLQLMLAMMPALDYIVFRKVYMYTWTM